MWSALFQHGIALEPHLQNTVIGFSDGWPTRVWIRDLEGTKLLAQRWPAARLHGVGERARQSLYYTPEQAWNRVAYCALVNNLAEAIFHLSDGAAVLEARLWQCVAEIAARWQQRNGAQPALQGLIDGAPLPGKNNLGTRLLQRADRQSDYTALPNPSRQCMPCSRWPHESADRCHGGARSGGAVTCAHSDAPLCAYVYDLAALDAHAAWMRAQLPPGCTLFYAAKANAEPQILQTLAPYVDGSKPHPVASSPGCISSNRMRVAVWWAGQTGERTGAGRAPARLHRACGKLGELQRLAAIARQIAQPDRRRIPVFLRMNIAVPGAQTTRLMMGGQPSPFGLDPDDLDAALMQLRASLALELRGFHFHLMSHQRDAAAQLHLIAAYLRTVQHWRQRHGLGPLLVNAGGGFGVDYLTPEASFDWAGFCAGLPAVLHAHGDGLQLRLERAAMSAPAAAGT